MQLERNQSHHRVAELPRDPKNLHSPRIHLFLRQRIPFQILFILTQQGMTWSQCRCRSLMALQTALD
jgi:hypothetical protein